MLPQVVVFDNEWQGVIEPLVGNRGKGLLFRSGEQVSTVYGQSPAEVVKEMKDARRRNRAYETRQAYMAETPEAAV